MAPKRNVMLLYAIVSTVVAVVPTTAQLQVPSLESVRVEALVSLRYARTHVTCHMYNPHSRSSPLNFTLLLPEDAFVTAFSMVSEGKEYVASIQDADLAEETYSRVEGLEEEAGLIAKSSRDANIFEVSMTARPLRRVTFKLTHEQALTRVNDLYSLPIHLHRGMMRADIMVTVTINETSPLRKLQVSQFRDYNQQGQFEENTIASISNVNESNAVVTWRPSRQWLRRWAPGGGGVMDVQYDVQPTEEVVVDADGNFVGIFNLNETDPLPKHVVFVLDVSSSMHGHKMNKMQQAMSVILDDLAPHDEFSLILFSTKVMVWTGSPTCSVVTHKSPVPEMVLSATAVNISKAKKCVGKLRAFGGTDIHESLSRALDASTVAQARNSGGRTDQVQLMIVFLTDGMANGRVRDPVRIANSFTDRNRQVKASLFGIGFGDDVDFKFLKKITSQNGGFAKRVYDAEDAAKQLLNFYKTISSPVLSNVKFEYDNRDELILVTPNNVPIYFNGTSVVQVGKVPPGGQVSGTVTTGQGNVPIPPATLVTGLPAEFLKRLAVYKNIQNLISKGDAASAADARDLALDHGFVTKYTSLIVTRPEEEPIIAYEAPTTSGRSISFGPLEETRDPPEDMVTPFTGLGLADLGWLTVSGNDSYAVPDSATYLRGMKMAVHEDVVRYQSCSTPEGEAGHCYHLQHCVLHHFMENFATFRNYYCKIQDSYVGVCCPDKLTESTEEL